MSNKELVKAAFDAMGKAYAPYSGYTVGAALLGKSGTLYTGCNVESASYSPTNCAERTAIFSAVADGERKFAAIAVCGGEIGKKRIFCTPCGVCRQVLSEFCDASLKVILEDGEGGIKALTLGELLPFSFNM